MSVIVSTNRTPVLVDKATTTILDIEEGLYWHQIDTNGPTSGTLVLNVNFGAGERTIATIDFTEVNRLPILLFGDVSSISLVPTSLNVDYNVTYVLHKGKM